ncbi:MAG: hypothetical protein ABI411_21575 [Tahibacter sp.]
MTAATKRLYWPGLAISLILIKALLCLADPTLRFFLGDSESYLYSALTGWIPPDRSFVYGILVRLSAVYTGSLYGLLVVQSMCGVLTSLICARLALELGASRSIGVLLAILVCLEPAQLFYERMVMAESPGTLCLLVMFTCGFLYLKHGRWGWLPLMSLAGITTVALRMSLLPVVLGFALLPPLLLLFQRGRAHFLQAGMHVCIAILCTAGFHKGYMQLYGTVAHSDPDYLGTSGLFRLGLVSPLVKAEHLTRLGLSADLLQSVRQPLGDHRAREAQIWMDDGLIQVLKRATGEDADRYARKIAARALQDDIPGFLGLAWATTADYFVDTQTAPRMQDDLGTRALPDEMAQSLRTQLGYEASSVHAQRNLMSRYFETSANWLIFCLFGLAPLAVATLVRLWHIRRTAALLLAFTAIGMVTGQLLFSHIVSFRYLHPFAPLLWMTLAVLITPRRDAPIDPQA